MYATGPVAFLPVGGARRFQPSYGTTVGGTGAAMAASGAAKGLSIAGGAAAAAAAAGATVGSAVPIIGTAIGAAAGLIVGLVVGGKARNKEVAAVAKQYGLPNPDGIYGFTKKALQWDTAKVKEKLAKYRQLERLETDKKADIWQPRTWFRSEKRMDHKVTMLEAVLAYKQGGGKGGGKKGKAGKGTGMVMKVGTRPEGALATGPAATTSIPWVPIGVGLGAFAVLGIVVAATRKGRRT
jgi:hypothetical protein